MRFLLKKTFFQRRYNMSPVIKITTKTVFLDQHSNEDERQYVWAYHITITNQSDDSVQLMNRHWKISDDSGYIKEVKGKGVIGKQPILKPGEQFEYASSTRLNSPSGIMFGNYEMSDQKGDLFLVQIPAFSLDAPDYQSFIN